MEKHRIRIQNRYQSHNQHKNKNRYSTIMRCQQILALAALAAPAVLAAELKVDVYDGVKECEDSEKVKSGDYLKMHYTGTIDESSETGEKGKKFDSSRDRSDTFDFQIGQGRVIKGCKFLILSVSCCALFL